MSCKFHLERDVNQILWYSVFGDAHPYGVDGNSFENEVFEVRSYDWSEENNDYHFYHKPSGLKIYWYKYPLRSPMSNMEITHEQFLAVLRDCFNSLKTNVSYQIDPWWTKRDVKTDEISQLNPKDIKKALECCRDALHNPAFCKECPYYEKENCSIVSANDTFALINYYEKEIKRLESLLGVVVKSKNNYADQLEQVIKDLKTAKSEQLETLNRFAEKLKDKKGKNYPFTSTVFISDIDKTYEEIAKSLNRHEKESKGEK